MPQSVRTNAKTGEQGALAGTGSSPSTAPLTGRANEWQVEWEQGTNGRHRNDANDDGQEVIMAATKTLASKDTHE